MQQINHILCLISNCGLVDNKCWHSASLSSNLFRNRDFCFYFDDVKKKKIVFAFNERIWGKSLLQSPEDFRQVYASPSQWCCSYAVDWEPYGDATLYPDIHLKKIPDNTSRIGVNVGYCDWSIQNVSSGSAAFPGHSKEDIHRRRLSNRSIDIRK